MDSGRRLWLWQVLWEIEDDFFLRFDYVGMGTLLLIMRGAKKELVHSVLLFRTTCALV